MLVDLFTGTAEKAFMSINLQGPVGSPHPSFATNGSAGSSGILGVDPNGQVQPNVIQQVPGGDKLLKKLGIQPGADSNGTAAPSTTTTGTGGAATTVQPVTPTTPKQPTVTVPGLGDIQLPFGKKKKKKPAVDNTTTAPTTTAPTTTAPTTTAPPTDQTPTTVPPPTDQAPTQ